MMHTILIVDFSVYAQSLAKIFTESDYSVDICDSAFDAIAKLKSRDYDLVISEVELPGDNSFDLYRYMKQNYPYIPVIMTTDKNIDIFFETIFHEGIGNVLCKPLKKNEVLIFVDKLISKKNIFGLENYIDGIVEINKIQIKKSIQIRKAVDHVINEIERWGFPVENPMILRLVLSEMVINAVYHSHDLTREKEARKPVILGPDQRVDLFYGRSNDKYGISIVDYQGKLTKAMILESINRVIAQSNMLENTLAINNEIMNMISETGRGIDLVRKLTGEYYFVLKQRIRTEILIVFDTRFNEDDTVDYSSLKIIEDLDPR